MKKILVFGVTGSIGQQALEIIKSNSEFELVGFSFNNNFSLAKKIQKEFNVLFCYSPTINLINTVDSYEQLVVKTKPDLILNAITGFAGLEITKLAMQYKITLALANKESLVIAGKLINEYRLKNPNWKLWPVDSEHSSLMQMLLMKQDSIEQIYITASGGPFWNLSLDKQKNKTFLEAIKHPNWQMGYKISIDSATLVNKCFEMIEAKYLFVNYKINAIQHPQSFVHALVEFIDGSYLANFSYPDMKIPISLAFNDFEIKLVNNKKTINFNNLHFDFSEIDLQKWIPIQWAKEVIETDNNTIGCIISLVDDYVIELFKNNKISFLMIVEIINKYVQKYKTKLINNWNDIYDLKLLIENDLKNEYELSDER